MNGKIVFRIVSAIVASLVMIAAIAGIAYFAFNAGVAQGLPVAIQASEGQSLPAPYPPFGYGYGFGMPWHPFMFGFGCFGLLIPLFLFFVAMKAFRFMFWGPRWGHGMHGHGPWRHGWGENGFPPMFDEWHKRAHGEQPAEEKKE